MQTHTHDVDCFDVIAIYVQSSYLVCTNIHIGALHTTLYMQHRFSLSRYYGKCSPANWEEYMQQYACVCGGLHMHIHKDGKLKGIMPSLSLA